MSVVALEVPMCSAFDAVLGDVSRSVSDETGLLELTSRACSAATSFFAGVSWASVMAQLDARPVTVAATDLRALLLDHAQYREDDGPGLHAIRTGSSAVMTSEGRGDRWDGLPVVAGAIGMQWSVAVPLAAGGGWVGALNLYGTDPGPVPALDQLVLADLLPNLQQGFDGYLASGQQGSSSHDFGSGL